MKRKVKVKVTKEIEDEIEQAIKQLGLSPKLEGAVLYTLKLPGKRLRPRFVMASARDFNVDEDIAIKVACATEMMHAGSLIHDDLPAIDNDDYRRGQPSNHVAFGEDIAIMAGDLLFSVADYMCTKSKSNDVIKAFTQTLIELVDGETRDIIMSKKGYKPSEAEILQMYRGKTGALFAFSFSFGPLMAGIDPSSYREAGYEFGTYFQIRDDILDVTATFEQIGKTPKKDLKENKATIVKIMGVTQAQKFAEDIRDGILSKVKKGFLYDEIEKMLLDKK